MEKVPKIPPKSPVDPQTLANRQSFSILPQPHSPETPMKLLIRRLRAICVDRRLTDSGGSNTSIVIQRMVCQG